MCSSKPLAAITGWVVQWSTHTLLMCLLLFCILIGHVLIHG